MRCPASTPDRAARGEEPDRLAHGSRAWVVRRLVAGMRWLTARREETRAANVRLIAARRRWELALGARWTARGWLDAPEEYFWLRIEDAQRVVDAAVPPPSDWLRQQVARHRAQHQEWKTTPMPDEWVEGACGVPTDVGAALVAAQGDGRPYDGRQADLSTPHCALRTAHGERSELLGLPISPGLVEGTVMVISGPEEADRMQPGAILVAPVVGPSWLPLIMAARGLVVEMGSTLSHGAILAREYGLPAVANIPGAMRLLRTGERIRLDGARGVIQRLE